MGTVFICRDTGLAPLLDAAAEALVAGGHAVLRGPVDEPGRRKTYDAAERAAFIAPADIAVFTPRHACSRTLMEGAPRLRGICSPVIGVESIDLPAADELGLIIGHGAVPANVIGMAEATVMLMLMLLYDVQTNVARVREGLWRRAGAHGHHHARQFAGRQVGLIGFGRIARAVAARLLPFGVRIVTYAPRTRRQDLPPGVEQTDLETLLRTSDLVSVHTSLTPETHHMIDAAKLALMKPHAYLINTARGAIIDEAALIAALEQRRIAGAALDTFEHEPLPPDSPLRRLDNAIVTPHNVGQTVECWEAFVPALVENIERMLRGELPMHCKNPDAEPAWRRRLRRIDGGD